MLRNLAAGLACLSLGSVSHARDVQLLSFAPTSAPVEPQSPNQAPSPQVAMRLLEGFGGMPPQQPPASNVEPTSPAIAVPLWMKTGVTRFAGRGSPPRRALVSNVSMPAYPSVGEGACGASYRPRSDLPVSTEARRARLFPLIAQVACETGVPVGLFDALVAQESRYQLFAISPKGAAGLTQLMPGTARLLGVQNSFDPVANLRGGARYLRQQLDEFGRVDLALAAYNAGPGHVRRRGRVPPFRETLNYVLQITRAWSSSAAAVASSDEGSMGRLTYAVANPLRRVDMLSYTLPSVSNPN